MKKLVSVIICLLMIASLGNEIYEFIVTNKGIEFYANQPLKIIFILTIGIVGGLTALAFSKLTPRSQHKMRLFVLASAAVAVSLFAVGFAYLTWALTGALFFSNTWIFGFALLALTLHLLAGFMWWEFWTARKRGAQKFV